MTLEQPWPVEKGESHELRDEPPTEFRAAVARVFDAMHRWCGNSEGLLTADVCEWHDALDAALRLPTEDQSLVPDLLAACKAALGAWEHNHAIDWDDLSRVIAKAEDRL